MLSGGELTRVGGQIVLGTRVLRLPLDLVATVERRRHHRIATLTNGKNNDRLFTVSFRYILFVTFCSKTFCSKTFCSLRFVRYVLFVTFCSLRFVRYVLFVTFCSLRSVRYVLLVMFC